jgi:glycosyltransferase involved in cell wall biosynthesis
MNCAIIIPAYNASGTVMKTIEACKQQVDFDGHIEIILVDDGSHEPIEDLSTHGVRLLHQRNAGPAKARNTGWHVSSCDIVCFTDADCVPEPGWVSKLCAHYISEDIAGVGGSYDIVNPQSLLASCIHQEILYRHSRMPKDADFLGSFNVSYRRSVLEDVGGFDESFRRASGEDNELAYRIKKKGYRLVFDQNIKVGHHHPTHLFKYLTSQFWHGYWRVYLYMRHPDMVRGDSYAGLLDFIQPPLLLITLCLFPFMFLPGVVLWNTIFIAAGLLLQFPLAIGVVRYTRKSIYFCLAGITFLRAYARGLGMAWALLCSVGAHSKGKGKRR